jgi:hypothetical protein
MTLDQKMAPVVSLSKEHYLECIGFATYAYLTDKSVERELTSRKPSLETGPTDEKFWILDFSS